jgi:hypothetical protein
MTFPTIEIFVETEVKGSPLEALLNEESYQGLMQEAAEAQMLGVKLPHTTSR